jgi:hypothetical protein
LSFPASFSLVHLPAANSQVFDLFEHQPHFLLGSFGGAKEPTKTIFKTKKVTLVVANKK